MSCNRRATTHIYLTPTDGSAGKVFPADIFGLPNVKVDKQKNTVTIKGKEYSLQKMEEIKDGRYNDFLQQKQFMQTAKQQISTQNNQQIEQVKQEIQDAKEEVKNDLEQAKEETSQKIEEAKNEVKREVTSETDQKIKDAKAEVTDTCTVKIQEAKQQISTQRAQEIQQAKAELAAQIQNASSSSSFSIGDYKHSAQALDHNGWLLCDGRAIDRTTYSKLYNIIGTQFGQGNRTTTFNLPNAKGRVSTAEGQGRNYPMAETGGQNFITLNASQLPPHAHQVQPHTHTFWGANPGGIRAVLDGRSIYEDKAMINWNGNRETNRGGNVWTTNSGSGSPIDVKQPYIVVGRLFIFSGVI